MTTYITSSWPATVREEQWWRDLAAEDARVAENADGLRKARTRFDGWRERETKRHQVEAEAAMRRGDPAPSAPDVGEQEAFYGRWSQSIDDARRALLRRERQAVKEHRREIAEALLREWQESVAQPAQAVQTKVARELAPVVPVAQQIARQLSRLGYDQPPVADAVDVLRCTSRMTPTAAELERDRQRNEAVRARQRQRFVGLEETPTPALQHDDDELPSRAERPARGPAAAGGPAPGSFGRPFARDATGT